MSSALRVSIGNDIVDLRQRTPALHPRFVARVFTAREYEYIGASWRTLWLFWAAKEAAYKALKRIHSELIFSPISFEVDPIRGVVRSQQATVSCRWTESHDYVYASCLLHLAQSSSFVVHDWIEEVGVKQQVNAERSIPQESSVVRRLALSNIARELAVSELDLRISSSHEVCAQSPAKDSGWSAIPRLYLRGKPAKHVLTFSHHGRFVSCGFLMYL